MRLCLRLTENTVARTLIYHSPALCGGTCSLFISRRIRINGAPQSCLAYHGRRWRGICGTRLKIKTTHRRNIKPAWPRNKAKSADVDLTWSTNILIVSHGARAKQTSHTRVDIL